MKRTLLHSLPLAIASQILTNFSVPRALQEHVKTLQIIHKYLAKSTIRDHFAQNT